MAEKTSTTDLQYEWLGKNLENSLHSYAESPKNSYLHTCSANVLLGFLKDSLPKASFKWKRYYLKLLKTVVPDLGRNSKVLHAAPSLLEEEVNSSGICFKADERDY